jgi:hypothetical protein
MNLIIDGHAFLNVSINVTKSAVERDLRVGKQYWIHNLLEDRDTLKEHAKVYFKNFIFTYLGSLINTIGSPLEGVHFVLDSKSWRRQYIIDYFKNNEFKTDSAPLDFKYKDNRNHENNHYLFFEYFEEILLTLLINECNLNFYKVEGAEGDDWVAYLCETLKSDIFIYTVDQDIKQLVHSMDKNIAILMPKQQSKNKKVIVSKWSPVKPIEEDSFFSIDASHISSKFSSVVSSFENKSYSRFEIDPNYEVLNKILLGDKSDSIPRLLKMTQSKFDKIFEVVSQKIDPTQIINRIDSQDSELIDALIEELCKTFKILNLDDQVELREHLFFNISIIRLNSIFFPSEVRDALNDKFATVNPKKFKLKDFNQLKSNTYNI